MLSLGNSTRVPINATTLSSYVLPPVACYFVMAVLAVLPRTRAARVALWPAVCLLALRAVASVDMSPSKPWQKAINVSLAHYMFCIVIRTLDWAVETKPIERHLRPANSAPSTILDALDLVTNMRGHGWNWSHGLYVSQDTRPTDRMGFIFYTLLSAAGHAFLYGILHRAVLSFPGVGLVTGKPTIFDDTLPLFPRYLRASIISVLTGILAYASMQMGYDLYTVPAILFLGQDPSQWPPIYDAPWRATSLIDFWGRRWHQWNRRVLLFLGGYPFSIFLGRAGLILGTFIASAVLHDISLLSLDSQTEFWRMLVGFGMLGPGLLAERAFYKWTGRKVDGAAGWLWTMSWLVVLGSVLTEGCARAGGLGNWTLIDSVGPVRVLIERSVIKFDSWLHTM